MPAFFMSVSETQQPRRNGGSRDLLCLLGAVAVTPEMHPLAHLLQQSGRLRLRYAVTLGFSR